LIDPGARYSAGQFARDASVWLAGVWAAGRQPVVVGGTGFYVRALAEGLFHEPPLDAARGERLRAWAGRLGAARLAHWAARLDRHFAGGGRQRAARVVEVALLTGRSLSWWQREARETGVMRPWYIHLTLPRDALQRRIAQRVDRMLAAGLVDEVRGVVAAGVAPHAPGLDGVGYREAVAMLEGRLRLRGGFAERVTFHEVVPADYPLFEQSPYALALAVKQHEVALREGLELMHVHYAIPHAATAWLAKQMLKGERDLKVVTTLHGTDITLVGQDPSYFTNTKNSNEQTDRRT